MIRFHLIGAGWVVVTVILALTGFHGTAALAAIVAYQHAKNPEA